VNTSQDNYEVFHREVDDKDVLIDSLKRQKLFSGIEDHNELEEKEEHVMKTSNTKDCQSVVATNVQSKMLYSHRPPLRLPKP
jgi:hypothetical protein